MDYEGDGYVACLGRLVTPRKIRMHKRYQSHEVSTIHGLVEAGGPHFLLSASPEVIAEALIDQHRMGLKIC